MSALTPKLQVERSSPGILHCMRNAVSLHRRTMSQWNRLFQVEECVQTTTRSCCHDFERNTTKAPLSPWGKELRSTDAEIPTRLTVPKGNRCQPATLSPQQFARGLCKKTISQDQRSLVTTQVAWFASTSNVRRPATTTYVFEAWSAAACLRSTAETADQQASAGQRRLQPFELLVRAVQQAFYPAQHLLSKVKLDFAEVKCLSNDRTEIQLQQKLLRARGVEIEARQREPAARGRVPRHGEATMPYVRCEIGECVPNEQAERTTHGGAEVQTPNDCTMLNSKQLGAEILSRQHHHIRCDAKVVLVVPWESCGVGGWSFFGSTKTVEG